MKSDNALNNIFLLRSKGECIRIVRQRLGYTQSPIALKDRAATFMPRSDF